jgi:5,10-methylene-tetrahydrofolate dehydrogenase/methenyl tetrahydrofolate cyclohydrolase
MKLMDGTKVAQEIREEIKLSVELLKQKTGNIPGLATVLVGSRKDSSTYVKMKKKAAAEVGIQSISKELPEDITQKDLVKIIKELNQDEKVKIEKIQKSGEWNFSSITTSKTHQ